jgi:hypothetical protein
MRKLLELWQVFKNAFSHKMRPRYASHDTQVEAFCTTEYARVERTIIGVEIFMVVKIWIIFWVMTPCSLVGGYCRFRGTCYLPLQGGRGMQEVPPKS